MVNVNTIIGNIAQLKYFEATADKKAFATFTVAVNEVRGEKKTTDFYDIVAFDGTAEFLNKWFAIGKAVKVDAKVRPSKFEYDNKQFNTLQLVANQIGFLPRN